MAQRFKDKKEAELRKELAEKRDALRQFRFSSSGAQVKDVREGRNLRKDIARILTELRERELGI